MKYISVLIILFAMQWSWAFIHDERSISQNVHMEIQRDLRNIISEYVQKSLPTSRDLRFERFWTESTGLNQVKASFIYSFIDENVRTGAARVEIEGFALLNRVVNEEMKETWSFDELRILNNQIDFNEPTYITPKGDLDADETTNEDTPAEEH